MRYHFRIHRVREGGYWAECLELDGCYTQGDSLGELRDNMEEALNLYVQESKDEAYLAPLPSRGIKLSRSVVEVALDAKVAFGLLLRHERRRSKKTQEEARELLGFKSIYSYQRLESSANPTLETMTRVLQGFPRFPLSRLFP